MISEESFFSLIFVIESRIINFFNQNNFSYNKGFSKAKNLNALSLQFFLRNETIFKPREICYAFGSRPSPQSFVLKIKIPSLGLEKKEIFL